jgi:hypothetical protein
LGIAARCTAEARCPTSLKLTLLDLLARYLAGSVKPVWSVVRVPSVEDEDRRDLHRELKLATEPT